MKKAIKKLGLVVSIATMMTVSLAGCAKKTECEICGEEKKCNKYEVTVEGDSETGWLCDDCADTMESLCNLAGGKMKKK